jgi:putative tryptophan/tyrosine transport system substrate-binding protein
MQRREITNLLFSAALAGALVAPFPTAWSQAADKPRKVGVLLSSPLSDPAVQRLWNSLVSGLREHGWEEGRNVILEARVAGPDPARLSEQAAQLVALKVDAIVSGTTPGVAAARRQTSTIPIIMVSITDPVTSGFVASLARPGHNITGLADHMETVAGKHFELLRELNPRVERVGLMYNPDNVGSVTTLKFQQEIAPRLGLIVLPIPVSKVADFDEAFATIAREQPHALQVYPAPPLLSNRERIAAFAIQNRLPTVGPFAIMTRDGLLMSYGPDLVANWRRGAWYVDQILKGAHPADMPVEQSARFELVINLKTAKALGLTVPPLLLARADEVIE